MGIIASDGLGLLVGDGMPTENFHRLKASLIHRFEINQRHTALTQVAAQAWQGMSEANQRRASIDFEALASDSTAALRLRTLALGGGVGNFRLQLSSAETLHFPAVMVIYREIIAPGDIKQIECRIESSGALTVS
jgi:hypothetical protein